MIDFLYKGNDPRDQRIFEGLNYEGPEVFSHCDWHTVARIPKRSGGDGQDCEIQESRMPARFFWLIVRPSENSVGEPIDGWVLSTGSGDDVGALMVAIAKMVSDGMIGSEPYSEATNA